MLLQYRAISLHTTQLPLWYRVAISLYIYIYIYIYMWLSSSSKQVSRRCHAVRGRHSSTLIPQKHIIRGRFNSYMGTEALTPPPSFLVENTLRGDELFKTKTHIELIFPEPRGEASRKP